MTPANRLLLIGSAVVWLSAAAVSSTQSEPQGPAPPVPAATAGPHQAPQFAHSNDCIACHNNLAAPTGDDVSIGANWRGSIMANSARDPYFHASVRRETLDHPRRSADIEDECATCHLPAAQKLARAGGALGQVFAHLQGAPGSEAADENSPATDGVTCTVCHQVAADRLGTRGSFNGNFSVAAPLADGSRVAFGPFAPDSGRRAIMHSVTGFAQVEAPHVRESELCASCHTLITEAFGPDGTVIGSLPEQMNYQEWRHSAFMDEKRSCQSCHMPKVDGPVQVASVLGNDRDTLSRHTFLGGNAFMLRLMNRYRAELGIVATPGELETTARATVRQLERDTATVAIEHVQRSTSELAIDVRVTNLTGHKFPTGYPSRRAWLHLTVRDPQGRVVFESGRVTERGAIEGNDGDAAAGSFEPHHEEVTTAGQVQIYESIMGTPAGAPTTGLLQATQYLKDNRLLPRGFNKQTAPAEIGVYGGAVRDADFAAAGDRVRYRVPLSVVGTLAVDVKLLYQSISFRWAQNLAGYDAPEPRRFVGYFNALASSSSVVVGQAVRTIDP